MPSIRLADVTFAYPQQSSLIAACTLDFGPGWTGVVGRNGEGKSTLLDLIDGTLVPQQGRIDRGDLTLTRCRQSPARQEDVVGFATSWTPDALRWMSLLDIDPDEYWRWDELSPGMRRRWQIGAALAAEPGVLVLDEPTNHLDQRGCRVLIDALRRFRGIGIVVSHDRSLLDGICDRTVQIRSGRTSLYTGPYSTAREQWLAEDAAALRELEASQDRARELQTQLSARAHRHASAVGSLSTRSRMTSIRDSDARSTAAKGRAQRAEGSLAREKSVTRAELDRVQASLATIARPESAAASLFIDAAAARRDIVLRFDGPVLVGERVLAPEVRLDLARDARVWLQGDNGRGKTTLLRAALQRSDLPAKRVLFVPQNLTAAGARQAFEALDAAERGAALQIGAAICLDARAVLDRTALSPGEVRKLTLAAGLVRQPWLVVLDEPTNDLDLDTVERLEAALDGYPGALLLVTHDEMFAQNLAARPWAPFG